MAGLIHREEDHRVYARARNVMPGGVNSPVRAFRWVGGIPVTFVSAKGPFLFDQGGRKYLDLVMGWGSLILGHSHPQISRALVDALGRGTHFGALTCEEVEFAEKLKHDLPNLDMVRLTNSGTEACMSAIRLARAWTGRKKIVKFEGCYHGHSDALLAAGSSPPAHGKVPCPGVPEGCVEDTLVLPYNDSGVVNSVFSEQGEEIAAIIVEPVAGNMGVIPPQPGFLERLREETLRYGSLLIFDEVITGYRSEERSCQTAYGIDADMVCLGKIIGGGLPMGAFGGKREIMELVAPSGEVFQAGTFSGNLLSVSAGLAILSILEEENIYPRLENLARMLEEGLKSLAIRHGIPMRVQRFRSMLSVFFTEEEVTDYACVRRADFRSYGMFFHNMLERGVYLPPSPLEAWFLSASHTAEDVWGIIDAAEGALKVMKGGS